MVMTWPELDKYNLKRSVYPVHYVYIFHSINSTHMVYRERAFDSYDTVLCVGPHHMDEIRKTEEAYGLTPKQLVPHGYGRLDSIEEKASELPPFTPSPGKAKRVLLAPSWGTGSFVESGHGEEMVESLLQEGHHVCLRLHPMTVRHHPKLGGTFQKRYGSTTRGSFEYETDMDSQRALHRSDIMVSDWSGAAFEYAFGLKRPVLYVDTPPKVNNPHWRKIDAEPVEAALRSLLGDIIPVDRLREAPARVERLCSDPAAYKERIDEAMSRCIYKLGSSGKMGAETIAGIADELG